MADETFYIKDNYIGGVFSGFDMSRENIIAFQIKKMMVAAYGMVKYDGLPDTIPEKEFKRTLQMYGHCGIPYDDKWKRSWHGKEKNYIAVVGGFGGDLDGYYFPKQYLVTNPWFKITNEFTIGEDIGLIRHDPYLLGLQGIHRYNATKLAEDEITARLVKLMYRAPKIVNAQTDKDRQSFNDYWKKLVDGDVVALLNNNIVNPIHADEFGDNSERMTDIIEITQYDKSSWFNDLGLKSNYNMKRESINASEAELNEDMLLPFVDSIIDIQTKDLKDLSEHTDLKITVDLSSAWKNTRRTIQAGIELAENQSNPEMSNQLDNSEENAEEPEEEKKDEN